MKNFYDSKTEWLNSLLETHIPKSYQIKNKHVLESDFGECVGIDFDSKEKTGYIYIWSSGMLGFGLLDIANNRLIIDQEFIEIVDHDLLKLIWPLIEKL
jgi:hypothetical protein